MNKEFNIQSAREHIEELGGYILSNGTLNPASLLASAHDFLVNIDGMEGPTKRIAELFQLEDGEWAERLDFHSDERVTVVAMAEAVDLWEDIQSDLNELAPQGYYFGSHPGNDSEIGYHEGGDDEEA